jgi:pimeloyl-ACP methyl ester carboxylesterase
MSAIVVSDGLVHYEVIGRGKPLVFIHGWLGSWRYWVPTMEELSIGRRRTYALDLWGFGDSDKISEYYNVDAYVELLISFLDKLGVMYPPTLVGHALGGIVALRFAAQAPDRVEQVVGVSVPLVGLDINRPLAGFSGNGDALARLAARRAKFPEVEMEVRKTDASAVTSSLRSATENDLHQLLPPPEIPVLLVYGRDDPLIKSPQRERLQECDDHVRAIFLNSVRHFPMLEERNKFNRLLKDFLDAEGDLCSLELKEEWRRRQR